MAQVDWDRWFIKMAMLAAEKSKDRSTKVGCVLVGEDNEVLSIGFNGFPRGVDDSIEERYERPQKYEWTEHSERNAIYNAARQGIRLKGSRAYFAWMSPPCADCTRALIQAGIVELIMPDIPFPGVGNGSFYSTEGTAPVMLKETGIPMRVIKWEDKDVCIN